MNHSGLNRALPRINEEIDNFDPVLIARSLEKEVSKDSSRLYTCCSLSPNFGGSVKAYAVGCNLRCKFCWSPCRSIEEIHTFCSDPEKNEEIFKQKLSVICSNLGIELDNLLNVHTAITEIKPRFLSPEQVIDKMIETLNKKVVEGIGAFELCTEGEIPSKIKYFTISGGEPTIAKSHLLSVLAEFADRNIAQRFLLQTNGFLLGSDHNYFQEILPYKNILELRICLKAGTPHSLYERTGASKTTFLFPFQAIEKALALGFNCHLAVMSDQEIMPAEERSQLFTRIAKICHAHGRQLKSISAGSEQAYDNAKQMSRVVPIFIDEEKYAPAFPEILRDILGDSNV